LSPQKVYTHSQSSGHIRIHLEIITVTMMCGKCERDFSFLMWTSLQRVFVVCSHVCAWVSLHVSVWPTLWLVQVIRLALSVLLY